MTLFRYRSTRTPDGVYRRVEIGRLEFEYIPKCSGWGFMHTHVCAYLDLGPFAIIWRRR